MEEQIITVNKNCWDSIAVHYFGVTALPSYGPLIKTEDELKLFGDLRGKKVLEIGCGSGHSLEYLAKQGAEELWGIDLSSTQIDTASQYLQDKGIQANLFCSPMEQDIALPQNYFDVVYSIYALGWTTDLQQTVKLIYSYLKDDGILIFSWDHPIFPCVNFQDDQVIMKKSYFIEGYEYIEKKGEPVYLPRIRLSTYINELAKAGFKLETLIEGDLSDKYQKQGAATSGKYYTLEKARIVPSSFILKGRKI